MYDKSTINVRCMYCLIYNKCMSCLLLGKLQHVHNIYLYAFTVTFRFGNSHQSISPLKESPAGGCDV